MILRYLHTFSIFRSSFLNNAKGSLFYITSGRAESTSIEGVGGFIIQGNLKKKVLLLELKANDLQFCRLYSLSFFKIGLGYILQFLKVNPIRARLSMLII